MTTDKHYLWHMAGAVLGGPNNEHGDGHHYGDGNGGFQCYNVRVYTSGREIGRAHSTQTTRGWYYDYE